MTAALIAFPPPPLPALDAAGALAELAAAGAPIPPNLAADELRFAALRARLARGETVLTEGALDLMPEGFGFLRSPNDDFAPTAADPYVSVAQVRALNLKPGQWLRGPLRPPRGGEKFLALAHVDAANGAAPARLTFAARTPVLAHTPLALPTDEPWRTLAALTPWRRGHRVQVVAADDAPRARWLADLARALATANPGSRVVVCLLDQTPEDLAAAKRALAGVAETVGTTFDAGAERHVALAELALARCQREVEAGHDVALLFDALPTLTLAMQHSIPSSGRWLAPGLDAQSSLPGKRLFAAARACAEGGSLTVIATTLASASEPLRAAIAAEFDGRSNSVAAIAGDGRGGARLQPTGCRIRPEDDARSPAERAAAEALRPRATPTG